MKIFKYLKWGVIAGALFFIIKKIKDFFDKDLNKLLDFFNGETVKYIKKAEEKRKEAEKIKREIKRSRDKRRSIRDRYSKIVSIILIFISLQLNAEYLVWDEEDGVWRDYGNITNYCKALELEKEEFLKNEKRYNLMIAKYSNAMVYYSNAYYYEKRRAEGLERSWIEKIWEDIDAPLGILFTAIVCYLLNN